MSRGHSRQSTDYPLWDTGRIAPKKPSIFFDKSDERKNLLIRGIGLRILRHSPSDEASFLDNILIRLRVPLLPDFVVHGTMCQMPNGHTLRNPISIAKDSDFSVLVSATDMAYEVGARLFLMTEEAF